MLGRIPVLVSAATRCLALLTMGLVLCPVPARADVVVHDGGVNRDRAARETVRARTGKAPHLILSADVLAGPSRLLAASVSLERCEGRPVEFDLDRKLALVTNQVLAFELKEAQSALEVVNTLLPCSSRPVAKRDLARLFFLKGATLLDLGDEKGAAAAMASATIFDPKYNGERGFPGPHIELLDAQRGVVSSLSPGRLFVWREPGMKELFLDGVEVERIRDNGASLKPGIHLLQILSSTGLQGMWIETRGPSSTLLFPSSGRAVWADGGRSPGGEHAMRLLLNDEFHGREGDVHTIHYVGRRGYGATYPWNGDPRVSWSQSDSKKKKKKKEKPTRTVEADPVEPPNEASGAGTVARLRSPSPASASRKRKTLTRLTRARASNR